MLHQYERQILKKFIFAKKPRYRDLKLKDIESNLFVYHLKKLIRDGYINKTLGGYELTAFGHHYIDRLSLLSFEPRLQPKITTLIILKNKKEEYLLCKRKRQPFYGLISFPYGKIHFGEKVKEAAQRELREKTGLLANLFHRGDAYLKIFKNDKLIIHMLCHIFSADYPDDVLIVESETDSYFWEKINNIDKNKTMPGFYEILNLVSKSKNKFFIELDLKND